MASQIPVVGAIISGLLAIFAKVGGGVATGPGPVYIPIRDRFELESYRGFSLGFYNSEHPVSGADWAEIDEGIAKRRLAYINRVEMTLDTLEKALGIDFRCVFPAWWERPEMLTPERLDRVRGYAARWGTNLTRFRSLAYLDEVKPRYFIELLPDPESESIKALVSKDLSKIPPDSYFQVVTELEKQKREKAPTSGKG